MSQKENPSAFKLWINASCLKRLAQAIKLAHPSFDQKALTSLQKQLAPLELKERVNLIAEALKEGLPQPPTSIEILTSAAEKADLKGFDLWPFTQYIELFGLDHFEASMKALYLLTQRFTAEFAIRPFLVEHEKETLKVLEKWAEDPNHHVRRLASEGSRPRLPWGLRLTQFIQNPKSTLVLLEKLKYDPELYVRKSVANHLNDISKDHPDLVIQTLKKWNENVPAQHREHLQWITRRALRTLLKNGNSQALELIGVRPIEKLLAVSKLKIKNKKVKMNGTLEFSFDIQSKCKEPLKLHVDYVIHHRKANKSHSEKVFRLKTFELPAKSETTIQRRHAIKPITTRKYYSGEHWIEIQINGKRVAKEKWLLQIKG